MIPSNMMRTRQKCKVPFKTAEVGLCRAEYSNTGRQKAPQHPVAAGLALVFPERQQGANRHQKPTLTNAGPSEPVSRAAYFKVHIFSK